jgi:hypothetical protein
VKRKYPYHQWEDYQQGFYGLTSAGTVTDAVSVLTDGALRDYMTLAVEQYPLAAAHHLTDGGMNQRAWLGWAACGLAKGCAYHVTRAAWWRLCDEARDAANAAADAVIADYLIGRRLF